MSNVTLSATFTHQNSMLGNTSSLPIHQTIEPENLLNMNSNWSGVARSPIDLSLFVTNLTNEKFYT